MYKLLNIINNIQIYILFKFVYIKYFNNVNKHFYNKIKINPYICEDGFRELIQLRV